MKRTIALLTSALMLTGTLAGCGGSGDTAATTTAAGGDAAATTAASGEAVKLVIAARGGTHVDVINAVKEQFEKDNNCTIEVMGLEADDLKQKVSLDSKNKDGAYDLCMIDDPVMPEMCEAGILLDLTENGYTEDTDFV